MKLIFMGTPGFAVPSLKILHESRHEVLAVVTAPDKERGRGQKISFTPVKEYAVQNNIPILQPEKLKDENFISSLKGFDPQLFVVVAFRILPREVYTIPSKGSFNLHASLLPKYRGAAPIHWAIINGETETGVTTFFLEDKVDTGNIILKEKILILPEDDLGSLYDKLSILGADAVLKSVDIIEENRVKLTEQNSADATPAPKITKETGQINWQKSSEEIHNLIRGLSPTPGAYFNHDGRQIKIYKSKITDEILPAGKIKSDKKRLIIGCGSGSLEILELQQEGKKRMPAEEFLRGYSFN